MFTPQQRQRGGGGKAREKRQKALFWRCSSQPVMELWGGDCACAARLSAHLQAMTTGGSQLAGKWTSWVFLCCSNVYWQQMERSAYLPFAESICRRSSGIVWWNQYTVNGNLLIWQTGAPVAGKNHSGNKSLVLSPQPGYTLSSGDFSSNSFLKLASVVVLATHPRRSTERHGCVGDNQEMARHLSASKMLKMATHSRLYYTKQTQCCAEVQHRHCTQINKDIINCAVVIQEKGIWHNHQWQVFVREQPWGFYITTWPWSWEMDKLRQL